MSILAALTAERIRATNAPTNGVTNGALEVQFIFVHI
jgi:hypothetical protein